MDESSVDVQVSYWTPHFSLRDLIAASYMYQTWSSADQKITLALSAYRGKPAVCIWNERLNELTLVTCSSLATLLSKQLQRSLELPSSGVYDSRSVILSMLGELLWRLSTQLTSSETRVNSPYSLRTFEDLLERYAESSKQPKYDPSWLEQLRDFAS